MIQKVTRMLMESLQLDVDKYGFVDVSVGAEKKMMVSRERLRTAIRELEKEGKYNLWIFRNIDQNTNKPVNIKILSKADADLSELCGIAKIIRDERMIPCV